MGARAEPARRSLEREWWLRALAAPFAPRAVFAAVRDDSDEAAEARQEPVLALAYLAGIAIVLASPASGHLSGDGVVVAGWALLAGAIYGAGVLFAGGLLLHLGCGNHLKNGWVNLDLNLSGTAPALPPKPLPQTRFILNDLRSGTLDAPFAR